MYFAAALRQLGGRVERGFLRCNLARYRRHCEMEPITASRTATDTNHVWVFGHASDKARLTHHFEGSEGSKYTGELEICSPPNIGSAFYGFTLNGTLL